MSKGFLSRRASLAIADAKRFSDLPRFLPASLGLARSRGNAFSVKRGLISLNRRATLTAGASFLRWPCPDMAAKSPRLG